MAEAEHHRSLFASYKETLFHSGNGMLSDEANAIAQSHDGYLWIGSYAGLMRYNGQSFQQMKDANNQAIVRVSCLFEDSRQRLWIGTADESLYCYENGLIRKKEEITATNQKAIAEDREGRIYVAAANGVAVYNEKARTPPTVWPSIMKRPGRFSVGSTIRGCSIIWLFPWRRKTSEGSGG